MYSSSRVLLLVTVCIGLVLLALFWRMGPLEGLGELEWLEGIGVEFADRPWLPWLVLALVVLGQQLAVPLTLMVAAAVVVLGLRDGFVMGFSGTLIGAVVSYSLGHWLGRYPLRRYASRRVRRLSRLLARRGVLSMVVVNLVPIGPHGLINVAAGSSHIRFRDFLLGTAIGILPITGVVAVLTHLLLAYGRMPSWWEALLGMALAAVVAFGLWMLTRWAWRWLAGPNGP